MEKLRDAEPEIQHFIGLHHRERALNFDHVNTVPENVRGLAVVRRGISAPPEIADIRAYGTTAKAARLLYAARASEIGFGQVRPPRCPDQIDVGIANHSVRSGGCTARGFDAASEGFVSQTSRGVGGSRRDGDRHFRRNGYHRITARSGGF